MEQTNEIEVNIAKLNPEFFGINHVTHSEKAGLGDCGVVCHQNTSFKVTSVY